MTMRMLIEGVTLITMNEKREVYDGYLVIEDDRIHEIGAGETSYSAAERRAFDRVIDGQEKVVLPGLIQTHVHLCQSLFRGQADDLQLMDWLQKKIWPLEASHSDASIYASARLGLAELIQGGTTAVVDMETVRHTEYAIRALDESGMRALVGKVMMDRGEDLPGPLLEDTRASITESVELLERWHGHDHGRIRYAFAPRFVLSCSQTLLREVGKLARTYQVPVHTHAAENWREIALVEKETGLRNIAYLRKVGLTASHLILAHCIWLNEEERGILAEDGVKVAYCPSSNLKLASGFAAVPEMQARGISVSLGADGAPCGNNLDMWMEMRLAALIHKPFYGETAMSAMKVLEMATLEGARAMGLEEEIGSLQVGKKADLIMVDLKKPAAYPRVGTDPVSRLVYSGKSSDVKWVFIDGKVVMEEGRLLTLPEEEVLLQADREMTMLLNRT